MKNTEGICMFAMNKGLLPDKYIKHYSETMDMISPFVEDLKESEKISYGLSSYGYDARMGDKVQLFLKPENEFVVLDPKNIGNEYSNAYQIIEEIDISECGYFVMPPHSFVLTHTVEYFKIPKNVFAICMGKSTYARCGIVVNVTPLEPGWEGNVTIELSNTTDVPVKIYANEGICQFLFYENLPCATNYKSRNGKYMGQTGITLPRIKE